MNKSKGIECVNQAEKPPILPRLRERRRQVALATRPWTRSTGPKTPEGKRRAALNGRATQRGEMSVRELRGEMASILALAQEMSTARDAMDKLIENPR
jgi:hypothetical protein